MAAFSPRFPDRNPIFNKFEKGVLLMNLCGCSNGNAGSPADSASQAPDCGCRYPAPGPGLYLAIAAIPMQPWETPYDGQRALKQGTIFPSLDLPFYLTGGGGLHG